jgi:hypothetical protein
VRQRVGGLAPLCRLGALLVRRNLSSIINAIQP